MVNVWIPDSEIDRLISEDLPYFDLTTTALGISPEKGRMLFYTRQDCTLCGTEEAIRVAKKLGCTDVEARPSGARLQAGDEFMKVEGTAGTLHSAWKVCLNLVDHCSGVATATHEMVEAAHSINPDIDILTTRKTFPGIKQLLVKAILAGGASLHRLGLSESVLVFDNHTVFMGGLDGFIAEIPQIKERLVEKKIFVETDAENALRLAAAGVDGLQFDKIPPLELSPLVTTLRQRHPNVTLLAAGGINIGNVAEYAATGVDGLVTTAPYTAKPVDMTATMETA